MTLVIPVFNGADTLLRVAPAVRAQAVDRIVYVDDGSTDATPGILRQLAAGDERVRVISFQQNRGRSAARNAGRRSAPSDIVLFLDADVEPGDQWAQRVAVPIQSGAAIATVGRFRFGDLDPRDPYHQYLTWSGRGAQRTTPGPVGWRHFLAGAAAIATDALAAAGGFPEAIAYGEDLALACALSRQAPMGLHLVPDAEATMFDPGTLDTALTKLAAFARGLPLATRLCPDALAVAGLGRLTSVRLQDRLLRTAARWRLPAALLRRSLRALPNRMRPLAVRYLLGHTLAVHASDAFPRATERP